MSLKHREDSISGIRLREAQKTKIATSATLVDGSIVLELPEGGVCTGTMVKFTAPCNCIAARAGLTIEGRSFSVVDATKNVVTGIGGVWDVGAKIVVVLDCENNLAYIQNASMVGVMQSISDHAANKNNPHDVNAVQTYVSANCAEHNNLPFPCNVDNALMSLQASINKTNARFGATSSMTVWRMYRQGFVYTPTSIEKDSSHDIEIHHSYKLSDKVEVVDGQIVLVNPKTYHVEWETDTEGPQLIAWGSSETIPAGTYMESDGKIYQASANTSWSGDGFESATGLQNSSLSISSINLVTLADLYVGSISDSDPDAYPANGKIGDTTYIKDGNPIAAVATMEVGSYTGTGGSGAAAKNGLGFIIIPRLIVVMGTSGKQAIFMNGATKSGQLTVEWSSNGVTWYGSSADAQLNTSGETYHYIAIGQEVSE